MTPLRMIIEQVDGHWCAAFPDEPEITAVAEGGRVPLPFAHPMPGEDVVRLMSLKLPQHQIVLLSYDSAIHGAVYSLFSTPFQMAQLMRPWSMSFSETAADPGVVLSSWREALHVANYATGPHLGGFSEAYLHPVPDAVVTCWNLLDWISEE